MPASRARQIYAAARLPHASDLSLGIGAGGVTPEKASHLLRVKIVPEYPKGCCRPHRGFRFDRASHPNLDLPKRTFEHFCQIRFRCAPILMQILITYGLDRPGMNDELV